MATINNLYPPIVDTYAKAFLVNSSITSKNICRIYFSLSQFNTSSQIQNVQIAVRNLSTNLSALNTIKYPSEIMIKPLQLDRNRKTDDKYYIEIEPNDMINSNFVIDQYYKVSIRFTDVNASEPPISADVQPIDEWLAENLLNFSEWSTVCLIRGISEPSISLIDFKEDTPTIIYSTIAHTKIVGSLTFTDLDEKETLSSYRIVLYDDSDKQLIDSGIQYTGDSANPNEINYSLNYSFDQTKDYYFTLEYTTENLYSEIHTYNIDVERGNVSDLHVVCRALPDEENGRMILKMLRSRAYGFYTGKIIIRRTDNKTNFTIWEDMVEFNYVSAKNITEFWYDYTIESGIWYKYAIQGVDTNGYRSPMIPFDEPVMMVLEHMYLTSQDRQLKIEFNPSISSFSNQVNEYKIDMLGSKYPVIKRDGYLNYATFPIGGTISYLMDEDSTFTNKEEIYKESLEYYNQYNEENNINYYNDYVYERFFRDKVKEFLQDSNVKLFRSPTEGNFLVKLMNISFTPNQTLGRVQWNFTCNASEIDECTIDNYEKYKVIIRKREG